MSDFLYCTPQDVRLALAPVSTILDDDEDTGAQLTDYQIADQIREAMAVVDGFISRRYQILSVVTEEPPLAGTGPAVQVTVANSPVRQWTRSIAAYLTNLTHRRSTDLGEHDPIILRYELTMDALRAVRDGNSNLNFPPVEAVDGGSGVGFNLYEGKLFPIDDFNLESYQRHNVYIPRSPW